MKRIMAVVMALVLMFSAAMVHAEITSRTQAITSVKEYARAVLEYMNEIYTRLPNQFTDGLIMATYHYYMLFNEANDLIIIENDNENNIGGSSMAETLKKLESITVTLNDPVRDMYIGWAKGEVSRDELLSKLMAFVAVTIKEDE